MIWYGMTLYFVWHVLRDAGGRQLFWQPWSKRKNMLDRRAQRKSSWLAWEVVFLAIPWILACIFWIKNSLLLIGGQFQLTKIDTLGRADIDMDNHRFSWLIHPQVGNFPHLCYFTPGCQGMLQPRSPNCPERGLSTLSVRHWEMFKPVTAYSGVEPRNYKCWVGTAL